MTVQLSLGIARAHYNRQLFSNHFLEERLRGDPMWNAVAEEASALRTKLRFILTREVDALDGASEAQTEERWIKPVLRALGWGFEVQPHSLHQSSTHFPDYALFASQAQADDAVRMGDRRTVLKHGIAVLEAKRWLRDLDAKPGNDDAGARVPSAQIVNYLVRAEQPWGILTNGADWRLYYRDANFADTVFFSVNLQALLAEDPLSLGEKGQTISAEEAFRYFYVFFRPEAAQHDPSGKRWLDLARDESTRYAREVEQALHPRAYRAVTALCRGFVVGDGAIPQAAVADPNVSRALFDNALTLLFRLLFLLHAEARDLLPVRDNEAYRSKSLLNLRQRAAHARDGGVRLFPRGRDLWNDLHDLFEIVDGDPKWLGLGIPIYNGGLFDPLKHPWLERHYVADQHLAEAIDLLSRIEGPDDANLHFVDYTPLDVRHLGSIYEGSLEYVLRAAQSDLPEIREHGKIVRDPVARGELYLATDKGERRTSGSYYTPDYIVQYIIDRTLAPLVLGKSTQDVLALRVLDPAMGSGHFLVAATAYLARAAIAASQDTPQHTLGSMGDLDPEHMRRLVVERCIFGVDKNPRAVELAKLALWLATVQKGKALNFLDHHLKCGDSLIGARVSKLGVVPTLRRPTGRRARESALEERGQYNTFEGAYRVTMGQVLPLVKWIEHAPSETATDVAQKEDMYRQADVELQRFRDAADLWTSAWFGNTFDAIEYNNAIAGLRRSASTSSSTVVPYLAQAESLAAQQKFFHWDIEFGEVFYEEDGSSRPSPGFDAVVGNPPYVRMEEFPELKDFLRAQYETYETRSDLYVYFIERSLQLLRDGGQYGAIVSNKFLRANYGKPLRKLMSERASVREIVDFGGLPVFPGATVRAAIVLAERGACPGTPVRWTEMNTLEFADLGATIDAGAVELAEHAIRGDEWQLMRTEFAGVIEKLNSKSITLGEYCNRSIGWGIKTGLNRAFMIDSATRAVLLTKDPRSAEIIKPLVVGEQVRHYSLALNESWLIYTYHGIDIQRYPAVLEHLGQFRTQLEQRATSASHEWYELQQPQQAYQSSFDGPKILYPEMTASARFAFAEKSLYPNNKCFFIPGRDSYLLGLLNSRLVFFFLSQIVARLEGATEGSRYVELRAQYMERVPIREVSRVTPSALHEKHTRRLQSLRVQSLQSVDLTDVLGDVTALLDPGAGVDGDGGHTDVVADFIGSLAKRISDLQRRKQAEVAQFTGWLEGELGCAVDTLTGKTSVASYYDQPDGVDTLLRTIARNHPNKTRLDVAAPRGYGARNADRDRIVEGFERSMNVLRPIMHEIELTDRLIDQIVYRLYGLTPDEIALVEAHFTQA